MQRIFLLEFTSQIYFFCCLNIIYVNISLFLCISHAFLIHTSRNLQSYQSCKFYLVSNWGKKLFHVHYIVVPSWNILWIPCFRWLSVCLCLYLSQLAGSRMEQHSFQSLLVGLVLRSDKWPHKSPRTFATFKRLPIRGLLHRKQT